MNTQELLQKIAKFKEAYESESEPDLKQKYKSKIEQLEKQVAELEASVAKKEEVVEKKEEKKIDNFEEKLKKFKDAFEAESDPELKKRYEKKIKDLESQINSVKVEVKEEKQELKEQKQEVKEAVKEVKSPEKNVRTKAIKKAKKTDEVREEVKKEKKKRSEKLDSIISDLNELIKKSGKLSDKYIGKIMEEIDLKRDAARKAKPFGWRFKGEGDYRVPTKKQRELYPDKVDYEARPNRADIKRRGKILLEDGGQTGKIYNTMYGVGKAKYVVNFHDGVKKHKDGSPFYEIEIFKNKVQFNNFIEKLESEGYSKKYAEGSETKVGNISKNKLKSIAKEYEKNEDENYHSENVVLLAKNFGTDEDIEEAKEILKKHNEEGYLSTENSKKRIDLSLKLIEKARAEMKKEGIEFANGGNVTDKKKDGQRIAKPKGWRWKNEAIEKGLIPKSAMYKTPSKYYRNKYPDYVYYEGRADQSDKKPSRKFISL
jgi:hypothetical protein